MLKCLQGGIVDCNIFKRTKCIITYVELLTLGFCGWCHNKLVVGDGPITLILTTTTTIFFIFYILLTVHHVMSLGKWPTWCTILFYVFIFIFNSLHVSSTSCSSSGEINCVNTTSGSCHSVSVAVSCAGLPTCTRHGHWHRVTATRGCIDTIFLSWWWARCAENM